jgi:hypothetical protein
MLVVEPLTPAVPMLIALVVALAVAPVAKLYVLAPVLDVNQLIVCALVVALPMLMFVALANLVTVVADPPMVSVVGEANAVNVEPPSMLVVNVGAVANTTTPVPVSSLRIVASCADVNEGISPATSVSHAGAAPLVPSPVIRKNFLVVVVFGPNNVVVSVPL